MGNGAKQSGKLSPLLFNIYMDNLSVQLHNQPIGCSLGTAVVNHLINAEDLLCLILPPNDYKHYLTYVTPTGVSTTFNIMLVHSWPCTFTANAKVTRMP